MKRILIAGLVIGLALASGIMTCHADQAVPAFGIEVNAASFNQTSTLPSDFEGGGVAALSLSPHISLHGSVLFGFSRSYIRATVGPRVTATDLTNNNFSAGFGIEYQASSNPSVRPQEFAATAQTGIRLWPEQLPQLILGAQGGVGLKTGTPMLLLGATYVLPSRL